MTTTATAAAATNTACTSPASTRPASVDGATADTAVALAPAYVPCSGGGHRQRAGQDKPRDDQADDVARMPVASRRQKAVPVRCGRHGWFDMGLGWLCHASPLVPQPG